MGGRKRKRDVPILFWVSPEERGMIQTKMDQLGAGNLSAYLRKMAIDGYVVNLDLPELKEMVSLLRRAGANLNQLTKRVHETGHFYDADMEGLRQDHDKLWDAAKAVLTSLAKLQ